MTQPDSNSPDLNPNSLSRMEVLVAIAITAIVLLVISRLWLHFTSVALLPLGWQPQVLGAGIVLGLAITALSGLVYRLWPAYRKSADLYLDMVLPTLVWPDLIWLGLLPGLSEELLFRGVMLPTFGLNELGILLTSVIFGIMHFSGAQQWPYVIWASLIGVSLGSSAAITHSLLLPITAHITTNVVSSCLWKWKRSS